MDDVIVLEDYPNDKGRHNTRTEQVLSTWRRADGATGIARRANRLMEALHLWLL